MESRCARCGAGLICDPSGDCWCKKLPHGRMPAEEDATGCLCRECLVRELRFQGLEVADCDAKDPDDTGCGKSGGLGDSDKVAGLKSGAYTVAGVAGSSQVAKRPI